MLLHSIKHLLRTPVKTTLFVLLLSGITALSCIGVNIWLGVNSSLTVAQEAFSTIGVVDYRNPEYPTVPFTYTYDLSPIANSEYVELVDERVWLPGVAEGVNTSSWINPTRLGFSRVVFEFTPLETPIPGQDFKCEILAVLYAHSGSIRQGQEVSLVLREEQSLEQGKRYITVGSPYPLSNNAIHIPTLEDSLLHFTDTEYHHPSAVMEITDDNYLEQEAGLPWLRLMEILENSLRTFNIHATDDVETVLAFHQNRAVISNGRSFSSQEYQYGSDVCIISTTVAEHNDLNLGDIIPLSIFDGTAHLMQPTRHQTFAAYPFNTVVNQGDYEIIGFYEVTSELDQSYHIGDDVIFIPQGSLGYQPDASPLINNRVSFKLTNGTVEAFEQEMEQYDFPVGMSYTVYDQGYAKVSGALTAIKQTVSLVLAISAATALFAILFLALLFVANQRKNIAIMYALGTSRKKVLVFLLVTVLFISGLAGGLGGLVGHTMTQLVGRTVYASSIQQQQAVSYSDTYGSGLEMSHEVAIPQRPLTPIAVSGMVIILTLVLSSFFVSRVVKVAPMQALQDKGD